jgi:hypothetical protein
MIDGFDKLTIHQKAIRRRRGYGGTRNAEELRSVRAEGKKLESDFRQDLQDSFCF